MSSLRAPVHWVSQVLYGSVLIAGLYAELAGLGDTNLPVFLGGFAGLAAVEVWGSRERAGQRAVFAVRAVLLVVLAVADGAGLARVLLVLIPFHAYFVFGRRASLWVGAACLGAVVAGAAWSDPRLASDVEQLGDLLMFALGVALAIAMAAAAVDERRYRARIAQLSAAEERNRLARDIHDDLGHHLTAIIVLLEKATAFRDRNPPVAQSALDSAARSAKQALDDVRRSVGSLRTHDSDLAAGDAAAPRELVRGTGRAIPAPREPAHDPPRAVSMLSESAQDTAHAAPVLCESAQDTARTAPAPRHPVRGATSEPADGISIVAPVLHDPMSDPGGSFSVVAALRRLQLVHDDVQVDIAGDETGLPPDAQEALYRAAQEGITNARRHARADSIGVTLRFHPHETVLRVTDDGRGFGPGDDEGFGLRGMRERVLSVGGEVVIEAPAGGGTRLVVTVPRRAAT